jgi:hypothetical protein
MFDAVKFKLLPSQTAELFAAVGDDGIGFTTTAVLTGMLVHCVVTVTEYDPAFAEVTLLMTGFCWDDVNPFGPVQLYVAPAMVDANKFSELPWQTGELLLINGGVGNGIVATALDCVAGKQLLVSVTETVYVPPELTVMDCPDCPLLHKKLYGASPPDADALRVTFVEPSAHTDGLFGEIATAICGFV